MMLSKEEAEQVIKDIEAAKGNPLKVIEIINQAGKAGGFNAMDVFNRIQTEKKPGESLEQTFKRLMITTNK